MYTYCVDIAYIYSLAKAQGNTTKSKDAATLYDNTPRIYGNIRSETNLQQNI